MSPFETALRHCATSPHGVEKLACLRAALLAHQTITLAATGQPDAGLYSQIEEIDGLLKSADLVMSGN
jgi:hypothetical protein